MNQYNVIFVTYILKYFFQSIFTLCVNILKVYLPVNKIEGKLNAVFTSKSTQYILRYHHLCVHFDLASTNPNLSFQE